ncbi:MAG: tetratricopeptide repeat protein [Aggregatilineales bacterium]
MADKSGSVPNREELYRMAVNSARSGQKQGARMMFQRILHEDPKNERVLLWLAKIAGSKSDRKKWLDQVLDANPNNATALEALDKMQHTDTASRNQGLFRLFVGGYAGLVIVGAIGWVLITLLG